MRRKRETVTSNMYTCTAGMRIGRTEGMEMKR
jgi:hypothetical protein